MVSAQSHHNLEQGDIFLPVTDRPVVRSTEGVISSGHYLTSMAGMRMLMAGGSAFDALVAAGFAAAVVEPIAFYSLAAEGVFMLYDASSGDLLSLSGQGTAPGNATADFYLSRGHQRIPTGPGKDAPSTLRCPASLTHSSPCWNATGPWNCPTSSLPAVSYAAEGIPNYKYMLERINSTSGQRQFDNFPPGGWDVFYHDREVPPARFPIGAARAGHHPADPARRLGRSPGRPLPADAGRPRRLLSRPHCQADCRVFGKGRRHHFHVGPRLLLQPV